MQSANKIISLAALSIFCVPGICDAKVTGHCGSCHTMHNSQGGQGVVDNLVLGVMDNNLDTPNPALLISNCAGCHTGSNGGGANVTPYVFTISEPEYGTTGTIDVTYSNNTLAGGNFYWVTVGDAKVHNVASIAGVDGTLGVTPPGATDGVTFISQLTCASSTGCHGVRSDSSLGEVESMLGAHHNNNMAVWKDGTTLAKSYRFLNTIQGYEDDEFEYQPTSTRHNVYYGVARNSVADSAGTISSLCAQCHGDFHNGSNNVIPGTNTFGDGVWLRHPTDFDMLDATTSSEYSAYTTYSVISPVATENSAMVSSFSSIAVAGDAIVTCLSCHRAHGTPNDAILRWDYKGWPTAGYNGCAVCHTSKD